MIVADILHSHVNLGEAILRVALRANDIHITEFVGAGVVGVLYVFGLLRGLLCLALGKSLSLLCFTSGLLVFSSFSLGILLSFLFGLLGSDLFRGQFDFRFLFGHIT